MPFLFAGSNLGIITDVKKNYPFLPNIRTKRNIELFPEKSYYYQKTWNRKLINRTLDGTFQFRNTPYFCTV